MTTISSSKFEFVFGVWTMKVPTCLVVFKSAVFMAVATPFFKSSVIISIDAQSRDRSVYLISE